LGKKFILKIKSISLPNIGLTEVVLAHKAVISSEGWANGIVPEIEIPFSRLADKTQFSRVACKGLSIQCNGMLTFVKKSRQSIFPI